VAGAAAEPDEDGGLALGGADGRLAAQGEVIAQAQAEAGERANAQEITAGDSVTGEWVDMCLSGLWFQLAVNP